MIPFFRQKRVSARDEAEPPGGQTRQFMAHQDMALLFGNLSNQIDPHFLYNSLECIRGKALEDGSAELANMTELLSLFYRYNLSRGNNIVTLREELQNVTRYMEIQKFRFADRFSLCQRSEDDFSGFSECLLPKLTLQPIVENAVSHGLEPRTGKGEIVVRFIESEKMVEIHVTDNGVGIKRDLLEKINEQLASEEVQALSQDSRIHHGVALVNVQRRLKLFFGKECGLFLYSSEGLGTDVQITIPKITQMDVCQHEETRFES